MKEFIFSFMILLACAGVNVAFPCDTGDYPSLRKEILEYEKKLMLGANLTLNDVEETVNKILMKSKNEEMDIGFRHPRLFAPGRNFIEAKKDIENSKVFQLIRQMPKGAVLHSHDTSIVSSDYIYNNITFRDDLYVCIVNGVIKLQFFRKPDNSCDWELLKKVREDPARRDLVNDMIKKRMSMVTENPVLAYSDVDKAWEKFRDIFGFINPMLMYKPIHEDHFYEALTQLHEDNVMYLEVRSTLRKLYDLEGTDYTPEDTIRIYEEITNRFKADHPDFVGVKLIYSPTRSDNHQSAQNCVGIMKQLKKLFPDFVAGFDLVGQEDKGFPLDYFADLLRDAANDDIHFFFHAGETNWLGSSTDENLVDALLLNTKRIGHGYALSSHPFLLELARRKNIAIEVNPISNQVLKLVDDLRNHAARPLFAEGYPVVVSNDDPGHWGSRALSYDFYEAYMALMSKHADLRSLKQLAQNSLNYSSLNDSDKKKALDLWEKKWQAFVEDVANKN